MRLPFGTRDYYRKAKVVKGCPGRVCACRLQSSITQKLLSKKRTLLYNPRTRPLFQIFVLIVVCNEVEFLTRPLSAYSA